MEELLLLVLGRSISLHFMVLLKQNAVSVKNVHTFACFANENTVNSMFRGFVAACVLIIVTNAC